MDNKRVVFASDIHLSPEGNEETMSVFLSFIQDKVFGASSFYILGDLFDFWIGKGMLHSPGLQPVFDAIRSLVNSGTCVTILHGNRDFLLGKEEEKSLNVRIPGEEAKLKLGEKRCFVCHGDMFCTNDIPYQRMKKVIRSRFFRFCASLIPQSISMSIGLRFRRYSKKAIQKKRLEEMDLNRNAVEDLISSGYDYVICGHIHNSSDEVILDNKRLITLSDWTPDGGYYAEYKESDLSLKPFSI